MQPDLALYPWPGLLTALIIALAVSALGFRRADWFISVSYGLSIAAQAIIFPLLTWGRWDIWAGLQAALLVAYGVRLTTHIVTREKKSAYAKRMEGSSMRSGSMNVGMKASMWISVAILYVLMYSPALMTLNAQAQGVSMVSLPVGLVIMALGLFMEGVGDWQKSAAKETRPDDFVSSGLYRVVRFPNYFGEMLFWAGVWVSGISAYASALDWILASAGILAIQGVMIGSAKGLEKKQNQRYGARADYRDYVKKTPILFPFMPFHSFSKD
jgi:steroid 5-alpha reductase family enzyme